MSTLGESIELRTWLEEELRAVSGEFSKQPLRLPPVVKVWMQRHLDVDHLMCQIDAQRNQLHCMYGVPKP